MWNIHIHNLKYNQKFISRAEIINTNFSLPNMTRFLFCITLLIWIIFLSFSALFLWDSDQFILGKKCKILFSLPYTAFQPTLSISFNMLKNPELRPWGKADHNPLEKVDPLPKFTAWVKKLFLTCSRVVTFNMTIAIYKFSLKIPE